MAKQTDDLMHEQESKLLCITAVLWKLYVADSSNMRSPHNWQEEALTARRAEPPLNSGTLPTRTSPWRMLASVAAMRCRSPSANTDFTRAKCALNSVACCSH